MARAWPFEDRDEPQESIDSPERFLARRGSSDAVVVRIGLNGAQLVLVDEQGYWQRWVYPDVDAATEVAASLGLEPHVGEYPEEVRVRMNARRRPAREFDLGAYPEQGAVGPVIPYPENRPRLTNGPPKKRSPSPS